MNELMNLAIKEGRKGITKKEGGPFGAVVVRNGKVVSTSHNQVLKKNDPTAHAEMEAIRKASKILGRFDLSDCEIYTTGKPCPMCKGAIQWAKISKVYYGCNYADAKEIGFDEKSGNGKNYEEKVCEKKECKKLYQEYRKTKAKRY